jgi:hypothetical protein
MQAKSTGRKKKPFNGFQAKQPRFNFNFYWLWYHPPDAIGINLFDWKSPKETTWSQFQLG